jgi:arylsulfatase A-like enzyme
MWDRAVPGYAGERDRARANYHGMLRLIDDQVRRLVGFLEQKGLRERTLLIVLSDHGDFVGEYGLIRKGPDLPECLTRIPLVFHGPHVTSSGAAETAHVSVCDIMPTVCDVLGVPLPQGVQGRSLWPMLTGRAYPEAEFASAYAEQGFGGLRTTDDDELDPAEEGAVRANGAFDCLNTWTQSGCMRMVRKEDWKLVFDAEGGGQLYNLAKDPVELEDLYDDPATAAVRQEMLEELMTWMLRVQDPLPMPRRRYVYKRHPRNYWAEGAGNGSA